MLEQSPNNDAICPSNVNSWLSYCNTYRQITSSCGSHRWSSATAPKCKKFANGNSCCENLRVESTSNLENSNLTDPIKKFVKSAVGDYHTAKGLSKYRTYTHQNCSMSIVYSVSLELCFLLTDPFFKQIDDSWIIYNPFKMQNTYFIRAENYTAMCPTYAFNWKIPIHAITLTQDYLQDYTSLATNPQTFNGT